MESIKKQDTEARNNILNGNIVKTMLGIILPLFAYAMLDKVYTLFDTFVITISNKGTANGIAYLGEIKNLINCVGWATITAMVTLVSQSIGAKDTKKANKYLASTFWAMCALSAIIIFVFIGFGQPILTLMNTPKEIIDSSYGYYIVTVFSIIIGFFNSLYTGIEKAKGRTTNMLYVNMGVIAIKMILSSVLAFSGIPNVTNTHFAWATIIAQSFMLIFAFKTLFGKKQTYRVQKGAFDGNLLKLVIKIALPLFLGSFVFYGTKIFINSKLSEYYGTSFVTIWNLLALICSFTETFSTAVRNTTNTMTAQNYGSGNYSRVKKIYTCGLIISIAQCLLVLTVLTIFKEPIIRFITRGNSENYKLLLLFFTIQRYDYITIAANETTLGAIGGLGRTNANFINQTLRTLVCRVPTLFIYHDVLKLGIEAVPLLPTITNILPLVVIVIWELMLLKNIEHLPPPKATEEKVSPSKFLQEYRKDKEKVLVFDCDGTLVNSKGKLTDKTYKALVKANKKHKIIIATGRALCETLPIFNGRPVVCDYMLCCDGAIIYDIKNNTVINYNEIPRDWLKNIIKKARKYGIKNVFYFVADGKMITTDDKLSKMPKKPIVKFNIYFNDYDHVSPFVAYLKNNYISLDTISMKDSFSPKCWVAGVYRGISKGERLEKLLTLIGKTPDDAIAFGDSVNDITMFKTCHAGVAMDNAEPSLKEIATYTTKSYDEDGVAFFINKYLI